MTPATESAAMLIDGQSVEAQDGRTIDIENPANRRVIGQVPRRGLDGAIDVGRAAARHLADDAPVRRVLDVNLPAVLRLDGLAVDEHGRALCWGHGYVPVRLINVRSKRPLHFSASSRERPGSVCRIFTPRSGEATLVLLGT